MENLEAFLEKEDPKGESRAVGDPDPCLLLGEVIE